MSDTKKKVGHEFVVVRIDGTGAVGEMATGEGASLTAVFSLLKGCKYYVAAAYLAANDCAVPADECLVWYVGMSDAQDAATRCLQHISASRATGDKSGLARALAATPNTRWFIMGLNLIRASEFELFNELRNFTWSTLQSIVRSTFLNSVPHLSHVHLVPLPTEHRLSIDFSERPQAVVVSVLKYFVERNESIPPPTRAELTAALKGLDIPAPTAFSKLENYALYLWCRTSRSSRLTMSRRSIEDAPPLVSKFKLIATFAGDKQCDWTIGNDGATCKGSEHDALKQLTDTIDIPRCLCSVDFTLARDASSPPPPQQPGEGTASATTTPVVSQRRQTRKIEIRVDNAVCESDKNVMRGLTTLKALAIALGCTNTRHGDYLERGIGKTNTAVVLPKLLSQDTKVTLTAVAGDGDVVTKFVLEAQPACGAATQAVSRLREEVDEDASEDDSP